MLDNKVKAKFAVVISESVNFAEGQNWTLNTINNGVPNEVVIMQLKSLLKNFENKYFNSFDNKI